MRKLPAVAQEERRRQVIGLRQAGMTYAAIAAQVGLTQTGVFDVCKGVVQNRLVSGDTGARKAPACEGRTATGQASYGAVSLPGSRPPGLKRS
jgi:hypothetical protein